MQVISATRSYGFRGPLPGLLYLTALSHSREHFCSASSAHRAGLSLASRAFQKCSVVANVNAESTAALRYPVVLPRQTPESTIASRGLVRSQPLTNDIHTVQKLFYIHEFLHLGIERWWRLRYVAELQGKFICRQIIDIVLERKVHIVIG